MSTGDIEIIPYQSDFKKSWDEFVESSKNGTFLFKRDYMDYHSDRFPDYSFLIYRKGKLYCLLPATKKGDVVSSHAGLTYGGLIMSSKCTAEGILDVFDSLISHIKSEGIKQWIYKPVPYIYSSLPSEEDLYALFRFEARLEIRNISSTIEQDNRLKFIKDRRAAVRKSEINNIKIKETGELKLFHEILSNNLNRKYHVKPVHTLEEMERLKSNFPDNIRLFGAFDNQRMIGGVLCYVTKQVVHTQYISALCEGKSKGAIDGIINYLLNEVFKDIKYFDFGISCEEGGHYLNENLIYQKEGFGGRAICYDTYIIDI